MKKELRRVVTLIRNIKKVRYSDDRTQTDFWNDYGASQACGSRYEVGSTAIPKPTKILLALKFMGVISDEDWKNAKEIADEV